MRILLTLTLHHNPAIDAGDSEGHIPQRQIGGMAVAKVRSPNYPVMALADAIEKARPLFKKEGRTRMARVVAAKHLGYASLNGRSLGVLAALRAYGLIEGLGDDIRVTDDAVALLNAPASSKERQEAMNRAFARPGIFKGIAGKFGPTTPSDESLRWWLVQSGFTEDAAERIAQIYLDSRKLASPEASAYDAGGEDAVAEIDEPEQEAAQVGDLIQREADGVLTLAEPARILGFSDDGEWAFIEGSKAGVHMSEVRVVERGRAPPTPPVNPPQSPWAVQSKQQQPPSGSDEARIFSGFLRGGVGYRLEFTREPTLSEMTKVLQVLQAQKVALADDPTDASPTPNVTPANEAA